MATEQRRVQWVPWMVVGLAIVAAIGLGLSFGACTQDDAFISFRYAANLLDGHGLVYNPGERVEGYTNLSWTVLMAGVMALGVDPVGGSIALGLTCLGLVVGVSYLGGRAVGVTAGAAAAAAVLLAVDAQAAAEAVEGLETALYMLLIGGALAVFPRELRAGRHTGSTALLCLAALTRPEAPYLFGLLHLGALIEASNRRDRLVASVRAAVPLVLVLVGLTVWRLGYYGEPLPNTFYAKTGGAPVGRGVRYIGAHMWAHPALWALAAASAASWRRGAGPAAALVVGQLVYVLAVGGDFKPTGRFLLPVLPALVVLAGVGLVGVWGRARWALLPVLGVAIWAGVQRYDVAADWALERQGNLHARRTVGKFLADQVPPGTLIAIHSAGVVPYYAGLPTIDMWGLTDHHIARAPVSEMGTGLAGHERSDPAYVFDRDPAIYLPEDKMFRLKAFKLEPDVGFPADFTDRYNAISIPVDGRWLNIWVRDGFLRQLHGR